MPIVHYRVFPLAYKVRSGLLVAGATLALTAAPSPAGPGPITFEKDVRPILKAHCFHCHGEGDKLKGGLDVRLRHFLAKGGDEGPALVPAKPDESLLYTLVRDGEMPRGDKKLSPAEIEIIQRWIATGAKTARPEPETLTGDNYFTEEERNFWAFQPIQRPAVPKFKKSDLVRTPVDAFLLAKLKAIQLSFSPAADKYTLIRRVAFDLTGLPPTAEEIDAFVRDPAPDAYERMIDHFLASPHYGERWGRHWLDVAGYADSDGYTDADPVRKYAYRYRDYVIRAINADKPFDEFIREQLAGDEMIPPPYKNLSPDAAEKLIATGFLRMAPDGTASKQVEEKVARNQVAADTLTIVSSSLLGLTVGCAQCHDHRYDPISHVDYHRLRAIFTPAYNLNTWRAPNARLISMMTDAERAQAAEVEKEAAKLDAERLKKQQEFLDELLEKELAKLSEELQEPLRAAYKTPAAKRTAGQKQSLKDHPTVGNLSPGSLYLYNKKMADELKQIADEAAKVRADKPVEEFIQALTEVTPGTNSPTHLFYRGDPDQPKQVVPPGDLLVLASHRNVAIPEDDPHLPTSGRRLAFANLLTDGAHPLTARVIANRVWLHHFGRGIVATPGDFGRLGERPTHPELLDWLASEFIAQGWSLKKLHKLILSSTAYRQSSVRDPDKESLDPDNRFVWRMPVRRLHAEEIRDAIITVSGKLNPKLFGPPVPVMEDEVGQVVVGIDTTDSAGRPTGKFVPLEGEEFRRSVYVQVRRSKPLGMLETFDAPRMEPNCDARNASTVALQALSLMNGEFAISQAQSFAERVENEAGAEPAQQVAHAWKMAFAREASTAELEAAMAFVTKQTEHFRAHPPKPPAPVKGKETPPAPRPEHLALANFCQALFSANRFLYVE